MVFGGRRSAASAFLAFDIRLSSRSQTIMTGAKRATTMRRKPYCARHSSVSWDLMVGRNPLWVAKQHGHSITTMLRAYAAWAEGAVEADIEAIQHAMALNPRAIRRAPTSTTSTRDSPQADVRSVGRRPCSIIETAHHNDLSVDLPVATLWQRVTHGITMIFIGGERGTRTLDLGIMRHLANRFSLFNNLPRGARCK
jgi:hypothetical protein